MLVRAAIVGSGIRQRRGLCNAIRLDAGICDNNVEYSDMADVSADILKNYSKKQFSDEVEYWLGYNPELGFNPYYWIAHFTANTCCVCKWWDYRFFGANAGMCYNIKNDEFRTSKEYACSDYEEQVANA